MTQSRRRIFLAALSAFALGVFFNPAMLAARPPAPTDAEITEFFLRETPAFMERNHIAGGTLAIVRSGRVLQLRGFGLADVASNTPVAPEKTRFRIGSISKLFVWTALLQQMERGALEQNQDVNRYLDFGIPARFREPITLDHLMSHSAGFEDRLLGLFTKDSAAVLPLRDWVSREPPRRVRAPGANIAYSNYGVALSGYILERISKQPFEQYIEAEILRPLKMHGATFIQPPSASAEYSLPQGYSFEDGAWVRQEFEYVNGAPAGSASATAADMARFMLAHLNDGELEGARILRPETARRMHAAHFRLHPEANGFAHGFYEMSRSGERVIGHGGDTIYFHSILWLLPERDIGVFLSFNTGSVTAPYNAAELPMRWIDQAFPAPDGKTLASAAERADLRAQFQPGAYEGVYTSSRRSESDLTKIMALMLATEVKSAPDGTLRIFDMMRRAEVSYEPVSADVFQESGGQDRVVFLRNEQGAVDRVMFNAFPMVTFARPVWYESPRFTMLLVLNGVVFLLLAGILRPTGLMTLARAHRPAPGAARRASVFGGLLVCAHLGLFVWLGSVLSNDFIFKTPSAWFGFAPWLAALLTAICGVFCVSAWRRGFWTFAARLFYTFFVSASAGLCAFYFIWRLAA